MIMYLTFLQENFNPVAHRSVVLEVLMSLYTCSRLQRTLSISREYYVTPLRSTPSMGTCDRSILLPFPLPTHGLLRFQASVGEAPL